MFAALVSTVNGDSNSQRHVAAVLATPTLQASSWSWPPKLRAEPIWTPPRKTAHFTHTNVAVDVAEVLATPRPRLLSQLR